MPVLYAIDWSEVRNGWNIGRIGKTSHHLTIEDAKEYIENYWDSIPSDHSHDIYLVPGRPYRCEVFQDFYDNFVKG